MELGPILNDPFGSSVITFRTSRLGRCYRSVEYGILGIPQEEAPKKDKKMFKEHLVDEDNIVTELKKKRPVKHHGKNQKTYYRRVLGKDYAISSTPDGSIKEERNWIPLEIKSLNPFKFETTRSPENLSREYIIQMHGEMLITDSDKCFYAMGNSRTRNELKTFIINRDDIIVRWMERRMDYIYKFARKKMVMSPEYYPGCNKCRWCLYKSRCAEDFKKYSFIYKKDEFPYNKELKLSKDSFDYKNIDAMVSTFLKSSEEFVDLIYTMKMLSYELESYLRTKEARRVYSKGFDISLDDIKKTMEVLE